MNTRAPSFPWSISLGNVVQILATTVVVAGAFYSVSQRSQQNAESNARLNGELATLEARVRSLETEFARNDERLTNILTILGRIDTRLERIEDRNGPPWRGEQ